MRIGRAFRLTVWRCNEEPARLYCKEKEERGGPLMAEVEKLRKVKQCIDNVDAVMTFAGNKE